MRTTLIVIQAAILTCFAVIGAQSDPTDRAHCPLPSAAADQHCNAPETSGDR